MRKTKKKEVAKGGRRERRGKEKEGEVKRGE